MMKHIAKATAAALMTTSAHALENPLQNHGSMALDFDGFMA